ncbi:MAG: DUF5681 domain-containing protein [Novosphingobium sp.]|nr:DUF5681 domain-containing protein [Novosphingobium sp.]
MPTSPAPHPEPRSGPNWTEEGDYIVGRGRTPAATKWKPGQSGNPGGRPAKKPPSLDIHEIIMELMAKELRVNTATGSETSDHLRVLLRKTYEQAVKGNLSATRMFVGLLSEALAKQASRERPDEQLSDDEKNVLATMLDAFAPGDIGGWVH